ncbi:MAG TPA: putative PEP-binding protein [Sulfuriferula sp.]|nr:putative PEP-binding protein [Sulfuriferula sp.]
MSEIMLHLQASPFAPGHGRGVLRRSGAPDSLLILAQRELGPILPPCAGLMVVDGAPFSHPMLRLLGLGIPTVLVSAEQAARLPLGAEAVLDGATGLITDAGPDAWQAPPPPPPGAPVVSADGTAVELRASVGSAAGAAWAVAQGAAAIGLVRSEFLLSAHGAPPDAAYFETALAALCEAAQPLPVTVRLVDIAADKRPPWLQPLPGLGGALGLQGARLYASEPVQSVFRAELAALDTLAKAYRLGVLVPYVVALDELLHWRNEIARRLTATLPVGVMAEAPAAVLAMSEWLEAVDFLALGCNDLMQCLFAADRDLPELSGFLDPYAPVLHRFLWQAAVATGSRLARVQVCGLLPQLPGVLPVLLGMGYRAFSVDPAWIPYLAQTVRRTDVAAAVALAEQVCGARRPAEVRALLGLP